MLHAMDREEFDEVIDAISQIQGKTIKLERALRLLKSKNPDSRLGYLYYEAFGDEPVSREEAIERMKKCCTNREDILLTPKDLFYISKELKKTPEDVVKEFCETYIGSASRFPIVRLYPTGYDKHCPLLNGNKCSVHAVKPVVCAMFPIGRVLQGSADGPKPEEITSDSVQYIFVKPGCGDDSETHTVREWFGEFGIPMEDEFFVNWQRTLSAASSAIRRFEKDFSPETMNAIWSVVFGLTYLNYDTEQDFTEQFSDNAAKVMKLISMAEGTKGES